MQHRYLLIAAIVISACRSGAHADGPRSVYLQVAAHEIGGAPAPYVQDGVLWGPVDSVAQCLGAAVDWQPENRVLVATTPEGQQFRFRAGHIFFLDQDDKRIALPAPMMIADGVLVAPLAKVIEALGGQLTWHEDWTCCYVTVPMAEPVVRGDDEGLVVELATTGLITGRVDYLEDPYRAFLDISGAAPHSPSGRRYLGKFGVWRLRWGQFSSTPPIARYVLDLETEQKAIWLPRADGRGGSLIVGRIDGDEPELPLRYPELKTARIYRTPDEATVAEIDLSLPAELDYDVLSQPWRIRIYLRDARSAEETLRRQWSGEFIKGLEAIPTSDGINVDLYLNELIGFDLKTGPARDDWRVRLTFKPARLCDKLIMIDPGHGGEDTGARGRQLLEKDVNLDVAGRIIQGLLGEDCPVMLTRDDDVFVDLFDRPRLAQELDVDAFVSIHCNAMPKPDTNWGTETYYYTPQSKILAVIIHQQLLKALGRKDNGVRRARFVVIRETEIPSVLVELMYLNHREEEELLAQPEVRAAAAEAIIRGLRQYYEGEPVRETAAGESPPAGQTQSLGDNLNGGE